MFTKIEALKYRCLQYISQPLGPFHVLVGPNASGKTSFLDVVAFLGQLVGEGLDAAIERRSRNFTDLVWARSGDCFELALEAAIPPDRREKLSDEGFDRVRYEVAIGADASSNETSIVAEKVLLVKATERVPHTDRQLIMFPSGREIPATLGSAKGAVGTLVHVRL